jgi:hypothetical protein
MLRQKPKNAQCKVAICLAFVVAFAITGCLPPTPPTPPSLPRVRSLTLVESRAEGSGGIDEYYLYAMNGASLDRDDFRLLCTTAKDFAKRRSNRDVRYFPEIYIYDNAAYAKLGPMYDARSMYNRDHVIASFRKDGGEWLMKFHDPNMLNDKNPDDTVELP